ncbi:hypothetical protein N8I74_02635 [Chitiniphilus purpureus]|uniref:Uncharacterized protein n=1 Tax=Chitiniphilus purpureus TaxID=2981137 RepID=A0ABY6DNY8_9NEIS|nr:hypothetical protein [Chitiniphilus sp. CD1]UXY15933.1 hypothetical protein N8I74_02635 [Chitiniphilus sp. CD1]
MPLIYRAALRPGWWVALWVLLAAAWFGQPLLSGASFEHGFFGLFWYTMLALATLLWALPSEQGWDGSQFYRRWRLLGFITLFKRHYPPARFRRILLEQESHLFGRDSLWLVLDGEARLVFGHWRASAGGHAHARALAAALAAATGLPFAEPGDQAG